MLEVGISQSCTTSYYSYSDTICDGDAISFGGDIIGNPSEGIYIDTLQKSDGCDSIITLHLTFHQFNPVITHLSFDTLMVTGINRIQWANCLTGEILVGDTFPIFVPSVLGVYVVVDVEMDCGILFFCGTDTAGPLGMQQLDKIIYSLSPNPATNSVTISIDETVSGQTTLSRPTTITITDVTGREMMKSVIQIRNSQFDLRNFPNGVYFVTVTANGARVVRKLVKQ